jgi:hypothetical protein
MTETNEATVPDEDAEGEEPKGQRSYTGYGLFAVALVILAIGTSQVLSENSEREAQARKVHDAQSRMD